jgi:Rtf2 RING-finger
LDYLQCNEPYAENDVIPILPTAPADIARLSLRMKTLKEKGLTHSLKKASGSKKRKKNAEKEASAADTKQAEEAKTKDEHEENISDKPVRPQFEPAASKSTSGTVPTGIKNAATASLTAKVLEEQETRNKRRRVETNENLKSLFSSRDPKQPSGKSSDFMTRGFSIPANARR